MGPEWSPVFPSPLNGFCRIWKVPPPPRTPKELRFTLHGEYGLGADFSSTVPGLTSICARVLWEHLLDTQAVPATLLFKVEVF